jgi:spore coat protein H
MNTGWVALLFTVIVTTVGRGAAALTGAPQPLPADDLFKEGRIPKIRIVVSATALDRLIDHPRTYVNATIREGNVTYTNVSIRLKGGPGSFRSLEDKPAFTINFDRLAEGQKFHGLKKLHLNNSVQDSSYLSEKISRELFEAAGVPTPRAAHAIVEFNGRRLGLYVLVEGINKQFLRRYFKDTGGNLYDGHSQNDVTRAMRTNSGDNPREQSRLRALGLAAQEPDLDARLRSLEKTLDVDRFISFLAVEMMLCHWDGYALNRNNYRIYHDRTTDRMVFLPQGVDQAFQRLNIPVYPPPPRMPGLVAWSLLEIPEMRARYRARVVELLTNAFQVAVITNHLYQVASKIQTVLAETDPQASASYAQRVTSFCRRIQQRVNSLERQLLSPGLAAIKFENARILPLTNWQQKIDIGNPSLTKEQDKAAKTLLHIRAQDNSAGSWRSVVLLDRGQYRFEGKVRLQGVKLNAEDQKTGAGLRLSRQKFSRKLSGDMEWTTVPFDFEVQQDQMDVELVCELRASQGQAWFDLASLRLIRIE